MKPMSLPFVRSLSGIRVLLIGSLALSISCGGGDQELKDELEGLRKELREQRELMVESHQELKDIVAELQPMIELSKVLDPVTRAKSLASIDRAVADAKRDERLVRRQQRKELADEIDRTTKRINDTTLEIPLAFAIKLADLEKGIARGARFVPHIKDGKTLGLKVYAIRSDSILAKLGFKNGDSLRTINGAPLIEVESLDGLKTHLKAGATIKVALNRRGTDLTLRFAIR